MSTKEVSISEDISNVLKLFLEEKYGIKDYLLDISSITKPRENYVGIITKIIIRSKHNQHFILNLIIKSAPKDVYLRNYIPIRELFQREVYFYEKIVPELIKFQNEKGILEPFNAFAKLYGFNMEETKESLILENMRELGFVLHDHPMKYEETSLVMREYGKFHAISFALKDQKPDLFKKISNDINEVVYNHLVKSEDFNKNVKHECSRALNVINSETHKALVEKLQLLKENLLQRITNAVQPETAKEHGVIVHGDCWVNNLLFKYYDPSKLELPRNLCMLDFQATHIGSPVIDISHLIFACTDKKLRDDHYENLILEYYKSFSSFLLQLGSNPEKLFPFHILQEHLKTFSIYGLFNAITYLYVMTSESTEVGNNVVDMFKVESQNDQKYASRITDVLLDYEKFGYQF